MIDSNLDIKSICIDAYNKEELDTKNKKIIRSNAHVKISIIKLNDVLNYDRIDEPTDIDYMSRMNVIEKHSDYCIIEIDGMKFTVRDLDNFLSIRMLMTCPKCGKRDETTAVNSKSDVGSKLVIFSDPSHLEYVHSIHEREKEKTKSKSTADKLAEIIKEMIKESKR